MSCALSRARAHSVIGPTQRFPQSPFPPHPHSGHPRLPAASRTRSLSLSLRALQIPKEGSSFPFPPFLPRTDPTPDSVPPLFGKLSYKTISALGVKGRTVCLPSYQAPSPFFPLPEERVLRAAPFRESAKTVQRSTGRKTGANERGGGRGKGGRGRGSGSFVSRAPRSRSGE